MAILKKIGKHKKAMGVIFGIMVVAAVVIVVVTARGDKDTAKQAVVSTTAPAPATPDFNDPVWLREQKQMLDKVEQQVRAQAPARSSAIPANAESLLEDLQLKAFEILKEKEISALQAEVAQKTLRLGKRAEEWQQETVVNQAETNQSLKEIEKVLKGLK